MEAETENSVKFRKLSSMDIVKIHSRLRDVIIHNPDKTVSYSDDLSDAKIADEFGVSVGSVSKLRLDIFGKIRHVGEDLPNPGYEALRQRIKRIENWIDKFDPSWKEAE